MATNEFCDKLINNEMDGNKLLPFISEQKYNVAIKRIFKAARRTFVGNLYKQVKDPNLVGSLSGHN